LWIVFGIFFNNETSVELVKKIFRFLKVERGISLLENIVILGLKKWTIYRTRPRESLKGRNMTKTIIGVRREGTTTQHR
jgi:hypothetical protein